MSAPGADQADGESTVTYRTVVKRGWMGARYEVQEPVTACGTCSILQQPTTHQRKERHQHPPQGRSTTKWPRLGPLKLPILLPSRRILRA